MSLGFGTLGAYIAEKKNFTLNSFSVLTRILA